jgi:DNA-binding phage protein
MELTRKYSDIVKEDLQRSKSFRRALLGEAVACMLAGDVQTGKSVLRTYINATIGFVELGAAVGLSPKSLMRMFSDSGNPQARNLFEVVAYLQKVNGAVLKVVVKPAA